LAGAEETGAAEVGVATAGEEALGAAEEGTEEVAGLPQAITSRLASSIIPTIR
jgi:hypothetical protein